MSTETEAAVPGPSRPMGGTAAGRAVATSPTADTDTGRAATPTSPVTARAVAFVAAHRPQAEALGASLADLTNDPDALAEALGRGLAGLADAEYLDGQRRIAPGIGRIRGVRLPLLAAVSRAYRRSTGDDPDTALLFVADRLFREPELEARWFAFDVLARTLAGEPERTWQLLRRAAREAGDWITIDSLAHPYAAGIHAEPYRWAEIEQLVISPSRWERRLVGSTIATMTHGNRRSGRTPDLVSRGLELLGQLMGDAEPDVQKALAWAYRSLAGVDRDAVATALRAEADRALDRQDGNRAWVIRDTLIKLDPDTATELRGRLAGLRRRPGAAPTSAAAELATRFGGLPDPTRHPEPPLT